MKNFFLIVKRKMSFPSSKHSSFDHQQLEPVVWKKTVVTKTTEYTPEQRAMLAGGTSKTFKNLDSDDPLPPKYLSKEFRIALQQARTAKKMTQKQLAQACSVTEHVIKALELPDSPPPPPALLAKINRVLDASLKKDM